MTFSAAQACGIAAGAYLALFLLYVLAGWRQSVEGNGKRMRLLWVAAVAALFGLAPLLTWLALQPSMSKPPEFATAGCLTLLSALWMALALRPPMQSLPFRSPLPLVDDPDFVERVGLLAVKVDIAPPRVRLLRTVGGSLNTLAWVGGLPQPSLVVTDGTLHRLKPIERDAIVAHEVGHIANHSLWPLTLMFPFGCGVASLLSGIYSESLALVLGLLLLVGARRIVSRFIEADCDRRAARAIGYPETISALSKIHALLPVKTSGVFSVLFYAMATHPSRAVRLSLLYRAGQREGVLPAATQLEASRDDDRSSSFASHGFEYSTRLFWTHRTISCLALVAWLAVLVVAVATNRGRSSPAPVWLWCCACIPVLPALFMATPEARRARRRQQVNKRAGHRRTLRLYMLIIFAMLVAVLVVVFLLSALNLENPVLEALITGVICATAVMLPVYFRRRGMVPIRRALENHEFAAAVKLGRARPKLLARNPQMAYTIGIIDAIHGDHEAGTRDLERLVVDYPGFALPRLGLCMLYLDRGDALRALEIANAAEQDFIKDPLPSILKARALRRLARVAEAQESVSRALQLDPREASAHAMQAVISLDLGLHVAAKSSLSRALELAPGEAFVLVHAAEVRLALGTHAQAQQAIREAINAVRANPFSVMDTEVAWLGDQLRRSESELGMLAKERCDE
jgi:Zn-dependent protease with chaperone function